VRKKLISLMVACAATTLTTSAFANDQNGSNSAWDGKQVPVELFAEFPNLQQPRLSPNGTVIATRVRSGGVQALALLPVTGSDVKPRIVARDADFATNSVGDREIYNWQWIDDDNLLIWIRSRDNQNGQWYDVTRVAGYNVASGKTTPLGWNDAAGSAGSVLWMTPPGDPKPRILLQRQSHQYGSEMLFNPEVVEIDVKSGAMRNVQRPNPLVSSWTADGDGRVRLGGSYDRDSGRQRILYRADGNANFRTLVNDRMDMHTDITMPTVLLAGSNTAYSLSNHEGYRAVYEYDLDGMKLGKKIFGAKGYDVGGISLTPDRKAVQGFHWTDQRGRSHYLDARVGEVSNVLEEMFGKGNVAIASMDSKRENILFSASELGQVPTWYLFNTNNGKIGRVAWNNDKLENAKLNPVSTVRYKASDGLEIEAVLTMPRHKAGQKNLAAVVMPHGGPWARDDADWDGYHWAQAMAEAGYVVIQPNYRGSTGYGKEFGKAVDGNWGHRMQDDLNDAVTYLASRGIADASRVCMVGWSYGGYAASRAAQRDGDKYRCAVSGAGVHDLPAMVRYDRNYLGEYGAKQALGAAGENLRAISPSLNAADFSAPILIVHGAKDARVPVAQSRDLVSRLKSAGKIEGKDFRYVEQSLNTHNLLREADRLEYLTETLDWLKKHNPA
jgi:dipeptidyl aminopeptidase/acylaminoacyl peptidase